jgi:hypothetical protein
MNLEDELVGLFERLLSEQAPNLAALDIQQSKRDGVVVILTPTNPAAAKIVAHTANGLGIVDFSFGDYSPTWELPYECRNSKANKAELLQEIGEMSNAVLAGQCEHQRGLLSIRATIWTAHWP